MPKYEIHFERVGTHPYYVIAENEADAKEKALAARNNGTQNKVGVESIAFCEITNKIRLKDVSEPYIQSPRNGNHVPLDYIERRLE